MSNDEAPTEREKWEWEQQRHHAERIHDKSRDHANRMNEAAGNSANITLRTLLIVNGGAAIALLAFFGSLIQYSPDEAPQLLASLTSSMIWFVVGVFLASVASGLAYFTNYSNAARENNLAWNYEPPYVSETDKSKSWERRMQKFHVAAIVAAGRSGCAFVIGMIGIYSTFNSLE